MIIVENISGDEDDFFLLSEFFYKELQEKIYKVLSETPVKHSGNTLLSFIKDLYND